MRYHLLLGIISLAMIYVTLTSLAPVQTAMQTPSFVVARDNPVVPSIDTFIEPIQTTETVKTPNGLDILLEQITNFQDTRQDVIVEIPADNETMFFFEVSIAPNATWGYGKIGDFVVVPQDDSFVTSSTSHYSNGDELVIVTEGNTSEMFIYSGGKGIPALMIANTDTKWDYDASNDIVKIEANNGPISTVILFWDGAPQDISFIEDTRREENLRYNMIDLKNHIVSLRSDLELEDENIVKLQEQLSKDNENLESARLDKLDLENYNAELKTSIIEGEDLLVGNVLLSPIQAAVGTILTLILALLLADVLFFKTRRKS